MRRIPVPRECLRTLTAAKDALPPTTRKVTSSWFKILVEFSDGSSFAAVPQGGMVELPDRYANKTVDQFSVCMDANE